jgi:general secretion pathway protein G
MKGLMRKVRRDEGGFTLIELLIVIIILGVLAAVVAFNVGGFLGQGTCATAKTEANSVQTALLAGMARVSVGNITGGTVTNADTTVTVSSGVKSFTLETYLHLPTHGNWTWGTSGLVTDGSYSGGGQTATLANGTWSGADC